MFTLSEQHQRINQRINKMDNTERESESDDLFVSCVLLRIQQRKSNKKEDAGFVKVLKIEKPVVITIRWLMK